MAKKTSYSVICTINSHPVLSWSFRSITQVCKFLDNIDFGFLQVEVYRESPFSRLDAHSLLEVWKG